MTTSKNIHIVNETANISTDFDFALGEWEITNKRRKEWLNNNQEWIEFPASTKVWKQLNGMVVLDEFYITQNGVAQIGSSYRIYNKNTREWTIYWASTAYPDLGLIPQVKGRFENGVGTFYGEEDFKGKKVRLRFLWTKTANGTPHWEQAYFDDSRKEWETNWVMEFKRI